MINKLQKFLILLFVSIFTSCTGQFKNDRQKMFEVELSEIALNEYKSNSPFETSDFTYASYLFEAHLREFGNSNASLMFDIKPSEQKELKSKLKSYQRIKNDLLSYDESSYQFIYQDLKFPEIPDWKEMQIPETPKEEGVEIYLIKKDTLVKAFTNESDETKSYSYFSGIYFFPNQSKLIYWFHIIENKNRH